MQLLQLMPKPVRPTEPGTTAKGLKARMDLRGFLRRIQLGPKAAKLAVILFFTLCWLLILLARSEAPRAVSTLEGSSLTGLAAALQQGEISGRDFQSVHGPGVQLLAWLATAVTATGSAVDGYSMIVFFLCSATTVLVAAMLLLCERISWKQAAIFYAFSFSLNVFFEVLDLRTALLLLTAAFSYRAIAAKSLARSTAWATASGILCFATQLVAFDAGIFAAALVVCSLIAGAALTRNVLVLPGIGSFVTTLALANLAVALFFKITSSSYAMLFDYQNYAVEILRGYHNSMGSPWELGSAETVVLTAVTLYAIGVCLLTIRDSDPLDASLFVSLSLAAVVWIRSAFVHSDVLQVAYAFSPVVVILTLASIREWRSLKRRIGWIFAAASLIFVWPSSHFSAPLDLLKIIRGDVHASSAFRTLYESPRPLVRQQARDLSTPDRADRQNIPLLAFPFDNHIGIEAGRPLLAPVLESYAAATPSLEQYYVRALQRRQREGFDVVYGADRPEAFSGGLQAITRTPVIFEYLYRHFELVRYQEHTDAQYILRAAYQPRDPVVEPLKFSMDRQLPDSGTLKLSSPSECGLVRLELEVHYGKNLEIFWPGAVEIRLSNGESLVWQGSVRPQEPNETFVTFISPLPDEEFHRVFGREPIRGIPWDTIQYRNALVGTLSSKAISIRLNALECMDLQRFADSAPGVAVF